METKVRLERLEPILAAHTHAIGGIPEEDAWRMLETWARPRGLLDEGSGARVFGRNTYPTEKPEPHGYEFFLTIGPGVEPEGEVDTSEIQGGLYAVLGFKGLDKIGESWERLWNWLRDSGYEYIGWRKGKYGWADGYEERLRPFEGSPQDWAFDLWLGLKE